MSVKLRIAVVDDDQNLAENVRDIFELAAYQVAVANDGNQALALFKQEKFDLAFVDVKLPDTSGQELVKRLTSLAPNTEYIMITANASLESAIASVNLPQVIGYEIKPVNMERLLAFVHQVATRKKAQMDASENRKALQTLMSNLPGMAYRCKNEPQWTMKFVSDGCEQLTGYTQDELLNNRVAAYGDLICESHRETVWASVQKALNVKHHFELRYPIIDKQGQERWVWEKGIGVVSTDDMSGIDLVNGFIMDITKEKNMESQLQQAHKIEAIGTLTGGIAHDFNNILGIILGNLELAMDEFTEWSPAWINLQEIKTATFRARDVVQQLLSFTRKTKNQHLPIEINALAREAVALLRASIPTTIDIRVDISDGLPAINADATQIQQIILNLTTNGVHAMENSQGVLSLSLETVCIGQTCDTHPHFQEMPHGQYVQLVVRDTGPGVDPAIMGKIFDPYFTTREVGKGTGLGLTVVKGIVNGHDGAIAIDSRPGKGTAVYVIFPAVPHTPEASIGVDDASPGGQEHILIVDDEPSLLKMVQKVLQRLGYQVTTHENPQRALDQFTKNPGAFDMVITDMTMPVLSGDELARALLAIRPDLPIILCTGYTERINALAARNLGIKKFIEKLLERRKLAVAVREVLDDARA
ncbi:hybrid sensor histidine kinase/response regulator [Desulfocicer niacini]